MSGTKATEPLAVLAAEFHRAERRPLALFTVLALAGAVAEAALPYLIGAALSAALTSGTGRVVAVVAGLGAAFAAGIATNVTRHVVASRLKVRVAARLRARVGIASAEAPQEIAASVHQAQAATVVSHDVDRVAHYPIARIKLLASVTGMLVVSAYLLWISLYVTLLVLVGVPVFMWLTAKIAEPLEERQDRHRDLLGTVATLSSDIGLGLRILRGLGAEGAMRDRFRAASTATEHAGVRVAQTEALLLTSGDLLPGVFLTALVWLGGHLAASGSVAPTDLVTFYAASTYLVSPLSTAVGYNGVRSGALVAAKNLVGLLDTPKRPWPGRVTHVPSDPDLFDRLTGVRIPAGCLSVLAPEAGVHEAEALGRRLAGLADDVEPSALLGDRPVPDYDRAVLRDTVRLHGPRATLFSGRAREVVDPASRHTDEEVTAALWAAAADDVVDRLPDGLETHVDADARSLSGGQRQRLALARSLLGDPPILILVEPTTALDAVTEIEVARRVARHRLGRTTVVLSHSGAFRAVADRLIVREESADV